MDTPQSDRASHSADFQMHLHLNGYVLQIGQLAPGYIILRTPIEHGPDEAEISLSIDGNERRWSVRLLNGIQVGERKTAIAPCGERGA